MLGEDGALLAVSKYGGCVVQFLPGHLELMPNKCRAYYSLTSESTQLSLVL